MIVRLGMKLSQHSSSPCPPFPSGAYPYQGHAFYSATLCPKACSGLMMPMTGWAKVSKSDVQ